MFSTSLAFFKNSGTFSPAVQSFLAGGLFQSFGTATNNNIVSINYDGAVNTSINFGFGFNGTISVIVREPSTGKFYIGGAFQSYNGSVISDVQYNRIIRLNSDGSVDNTFSTTGAGGSVFAIALDSAGKIYVGGQFSNFGTALSGISGIIRLNNDGSVDNGFDATTGFTSFSQVRSIVVDSADKIYVGGSFTTYKGVAANRIIKLNTDGSKDTSFDNTTGFNSSSVNSIVLDSAGKLYVGGGFTTYKGVSANYIIKLNTDGSKDTSFDNTTGFAGNNVNEIKLDSVGKLYVVGSFTSYKGVAANRIIKLNTDGSKDTSFDNTTGFNGPSSNILFTSNNKIYVTGSFTTYKGVSAVGIARLNTDGSRDTTFNIDNQFNGSSTPAPMVLLSSDAILVGGTNFNSYNPADKFLIKLNTDGTKNNSLNIGGTGGFPSVANNGIYSIAKDSSGALYVGGIFQFYNGISTNRIMKFNPDGTRDNSFNIGTGFNNTIRCIVIDSSGKIYVGGDFTTYNSVINNRIIRLNPDGSKDTGFDNTTGFNAGVYDIKFDSVGKLYLGGIFTLYKSVAAGRIIKLNTDGSKDTSFINSTGFINGVVQKIALDSAGKIYAVGTFTTYLAVTANQIIKLETNGDKDTSFDNSIGFGANVYDVLIDGNGKIYACGAFTLYKNLSNNRIIRLNPDGNKDEGFNNGGTGSGFPYGQVYSMALLGTNKLIVGSGGAPVQGYRGTVTSAITILNTDGTIDTGFNPIPGLNLGVSTTNQVYSIIPL
jgi:uncharacterized delta-60 repeat protein